MTGKEIQKEWYLDRCCGMQFAALLENGELTDFSVEKEPREGIVGNVYKGKIVNVVSGMNAAFVNCGLSRNCYLSLDESYTDYTKYDGELDELSTENPELKEGDEVVVQVLKPARGTKGAKVTTHLSFVGKRLIYLPNTKFLGISRKITDEGLRTSLLKSFEKMCEKGKNDGFIVRTQAPFATSKQLKAEATYLKSLAKQTFDLAENSPVGALLYEDEYLPVRVLRDAFGEEIKAIHVGNSELYSELLRFVKIRKDFPPRKLTLYKGGRAMFHEYGIMPLILNLAKPEAPLKSGGSLVIEHTEAMTVVDVNSGKYVGENSLEETVFSVNLEAAKEIARQVRLRNIGGIVVVDFIDMVDESHRQAITEILAAELAKDTAKCNVLPMSELCLVQFTRKRVGSDVDFYLLKPCSDCAGKGQVLDDMFIIEEIQASILDCFADGYTSVILDVNEGIMQKILNERIFSKQANGAWLNKRVYFIPHKTYKAEQFTIKGDNSSVLTLSNKAQILY